MHQLRQYLPTQLSTNRASLQHSPSAQGPLQHSTTNLTKAPKHTAKTGNLKPGQTTAWCTNLRQNRSPDDSITADATRVHFLGSPGVCILQQTSELCGLKPFDSPRKTRLGLSATMQNYHHAYASCSITVQKRKRTGIYSPAPLGSTTSINQSLPRP